MHFESLTMQKLATDEIVVQEESAQPRSIAGSPDDTTFDDEPTPEETRQATNRDKLASVSPTLGYCSRDWPGQRSE